MNFLKTNRMASMKTFLTRSMWLPMCCVTLFACSAWGVDVQRVFYCIDGDPPAGYGDTYYDST